MTDGQTFHFIPYIGIYAIQTDRLCFILSLILESTYDRQHFILFLILESTYDRRTDISFWYSYWDLCHTDEQTTIHFTLKLKSTRQTDGQIRFISSRISSKSTYERRTDISFHYSYKDLRHTDGQATFYFIPYIGINVWQTTFHFVPYIGIPSMTDGQTFHFTTHIGIYVIQTNKLRFNSPSNWNLHKTDRCTNYVSFYPLYWNPRMKDGQTFHFTTYIGIDARPTNYISFHFIPYVGI